MSKKIDLTKMPSPDLVREFVELSIHEYNAVKWFDTARYTKLFKLQVKVIDELKRRNESDQLIPLYKHPNVWVRLMAAQYTLALEPEQARKVLRDIQATKKHPEAFEAGMALCALERGISIPT